MHRIRILLATCLAFVILTPAWAADWPQWMGPERNGVSPETGLLKEWPKGGPKLKWKIKDLGGDAYSAPAVVQGRIYLLAQFDNAEHVVALDEKDGSKVWSTKIGKVGPNPSGGNNYPGPRGTPTVQGDKLYTLGSDGDIVCLDLAHGDK